MPELLYKELAFDVIGCAMEVHRKLGAGFLESVYQKALAHELSLQQISFIEQQRLHVHYKDIIVGEFIADFVIEQCIILEIKSISEIIRVHEAQVLNYLTATRFRLGLLVNFGGEKLQYKRIIK